MERPRVGETFTAEIDRISSSGNGIIDAEDGHINIGPVEEGSEGAEIRAEMTSPMFAYCKTESVTAPRYERKFRTLGQHNSRKRKKKKGFRVPVEELFHTPSGTIGGAEFCDECGSMMYGHQGMWGCQSCGFKKPVGGESDSGGPEPTPSSAEECETTSSSATDTKTEPSEPAEDSDSAESAATVSETQVESRHAVGELGGKTENGDGEGKDEVNSELDELRERAQDQSVDEVDAERLRSSHVTAQYSRSAAVREYVKARADGECEGCGSPAPFTSKTGEPYLHAHHIHELSDGGSDTPDTVIALCPNCHYRVHHGEDGETYNETLLEIVQKLERT